jgi:hypothetical protein
MTKSSTRTPARQSKQERRRDRREEQRKLEAARLQAAKRNRIIITSIIAVVIIAAAISGIFYFVNGRNSTAQGQTASTSTTNNSSTAVNSAAYPTIDGVSCDKEEQLAYHIHAHLSLYMNGSPVQLPANIGIASDQSCIYWLHVHDTSGVVHIEAPTQKIYTLGTFFHIWGQAFPQMQYPVELESTNDWQVYVNGKLYTGDFHNIPLTAHTLITMAYKSPGITPDTTYNWGEL